MTKKDYELIATTIKSFMNPTIHNKETVIFMFADNLASTNPRFDRARFLIACGVTE